MFVTVTICMNYFKEIKIPERAGRPSVCFSGFAFQGFWQAPVLAATGGPGEPWVSVVLVRVVGPGSEAAAVGQRAVWVQVRAMAFARAQPPLSLMCLPGACLGQEQMPRPWQMEVLEGPEGCRDL